MGVTRVSPETMQTLVTHIALSPTEEQAQSLASHLGAVRYAYNWSLAYVYQNWDDVRGGTETEYVNNTAYGLRKALNRVKNEIAPWWGQNSKEAFATGASNAARAFMNYHKKLAKPPKFRSRHHDSGSIRFTTGIMRLEDTNHFTLPRIGRVKLAENPARLRWLLTHGGMISQASVSEKAGRWFLSVSTQVSDETALRYFNTRKKRKPRKASIGIDVGLKTFFTASDGTAVENPAFLRKSLSKLRKAQKRLARRQGLNKKTGEMPSKRWEQAHLQVRKAHARIVNQRQDFLHKTTKHLVETNEVIKIEDLHVAGMKKNRHLSLSISDAAWGEFRRQLEYKARWYGAKIVVVPRFYPSSKKCSECGNVRTKLSLSERVYKCEVQSCGLVIDRDLNAALNIEQYVAQSCGETLNGRGEESTGSVPRKSGQVKLSSKKRQAVPRVLQP